MAVDLGTMLNLNALIAILLSVLLNVFAWQKKGYRGFKTISFSYIIFGIVLLIRSLSSNTQVLIPSVLYSTGLALGFFCMYEGIQRFRGGRRQLVIFNIFLVIITPVSMVFFTFIFPSLQLRISTTALIYVLQCAACCHALFRNSRTQLELYQIIVGFSFGIFVIGLLLNLFVPFMTSSPNEYLDAGISLSFIYFFSAFFLLTSAFGFLWGIVQRSEGELTTLYQDLQDVLNDKTALVSKLEKNNTFLDALLDSIPIPVFQKDRECRYRCINSAFSNALGMPKEKILNRTPGDIWQDATAAWSEEMDRLVFETGKMHKREGSMLYGDGLYHEVLESKNPLFDADGNITGIVGSITDITERKIHEAKIRYLAHHDSLTGLYNRHYFYEQLRKAISRAKRNKNRVSLMFIDLDGFKEINDTYGHLAGDTTLKSIGSRLQSITRDYDTVCRVGGDEFAFLLEEDADKEAAVSIGNKILQELVKPITYNEHQCSVSGSIGIAVYPLNSTTAEHLVNLADQAMYEAKMRGKNQLYFSTQSASDKTDHDIT